MTIELLEAVLRQCGLQAEVLRCLEVDAPFDWPTLALRLARQPCERGERCAVELYGVALLLHLLRRQGLPLVREAEDGAAVLSDQLLAVAPLALLPRAGAVAAAPRKLTYTAQASKGLQRGRALDRGAPRRASPRDQSPRQSSQSSSALDECGELHATLARCQDDQADSPAAENIVQSWEQPQCLETGPPPPTFVNLLAPLGADPLLPPAAWAAASAPKPVAPHSTPREAPQPHHNGD